MGDKKHQRRQMKRLAEIAHELAEREFVLTREAEQLARQRAELEARERSIARAGEALPPKAAPSPEPKPDVPVYRERPLSPVPQEPKPFAAQNPPARPSTEIVAEINGILKSVFWEYSNSVRQVSSQMSTVTAAMMCAAVTSILENRGFDMKEVFVREMERILEEGDFSKTYRSVSRQSAPAADIRQTAAPQAAPPPAAPPVPKQAPAPVQPPLVKPTPEPKPEAPAAGDEDSSLGLTPMAAVIPPRKPEGKILHIDSVFEFQKLGDQGFRNDESIVRVKLPEGIQYIPGNFFNGCSNLQEIWLPDSLLEIGPYSFYGCTSLLAVHIGEKSALREIGEYAFALCESLPAFTVPAQVEMFGTSVFRYCASLEALHFASGSRLQVMGSHLLQNCTSMQTVTLPDSITVIPTSMFYGCLNLRKVVAKGVHTIEDYAFFGDVNLRLVRIHSKKIIAPQAFDGCDPALMIEYLNY